MIGRRWIKKRLDHDQDPNVDPHEGEMAQRVLHALEQSIEAQEMAKVHAVEAQRLFGAIRREIAVTKVRKDHPPT